MGVTNSSNEKILVISAHCVINKLDNKNLIKNFDNYNCFYGDQIPIYRGKKIRKGIFGQIL